MRPAVTPVQRAAVFFGVCVAVSIVLGVVAWIRGDVAYGIGFALSAAINAWIFVRAVRLARRGVYIVDKPPPWRRRSGR
jgi:hypothetical protein